MMYMSTFTSISPKNKGVCISQKQFFNAIAISIHTPTTKYIKDILSTCKTILDCFSDSSRNGEILEPKVWDYLQITS